MRPDPTATRSPGGTAPISRKYASGTAKFATAIPVEAHGIVEVPRYTGCRVQDYCECPFPRLAAERTGDESSHASHFVPRAPDSRSPNPLHPCGSCPHCQAATVQIADQLDRLTGAIPVAVRVRRTWIPARYGEVRQTRRNLGGLDCMGSPAGIALAMAGRRPSSSSSRPHCNDFPRGGVGLILLDHHHHVGVAALDVVDDGPPCL